VPEFSSAKYWETRYRGGGNSGAGSYNRLARFKAEFINAFVSNNDISTVIEFGCGDGNQLSQLKIENYTGVDVSPTILAQCREKFPEQNYHFVDYTGLSEIEMSDLVLSMDVVFHLVEDRVFEKYISDIFTFALNYVIFYSSDHDAETRDVHVRHRCVSAYVQRMYPEWRLVAKIPNIYPFDPASPHNTSFADFMVFGRQNLTCRILVPAAES